MGRNKDRKEYSAMPDSFDIIKAGVSKTGHFSGIMFLKKDNIAICDIEIDKTAMTTDDKNAFSNVANYLMIPAYYTKLSVPSGDNTIILAFRG